MKKLFLLLLLLAGASLSAQTITWDGGGDGTSWNDPLNWNDAMNNDRVPTADDFAEIVASSSDLMIVVDTDDAIAGTLRLTADQYMLSFTVTASAKLSVMDPDGSFSNNLIQIRDLNSGAVIFVNKGEIMMSGDGTENSGGGFSGGINSSIENDGDILITEIGGVGVSVPNFTNNGTLEIIDTGYDGSEAISISGNELFTNNGTVIVENNPYEAFDISGITNTQPIRVAKLINTKLIEIRGVVGGLDGNDNPVIYLVNNGEIINSGLIQITSTPGENIAVLELGARGNNKIVNELCGVINIYALDNIEILGSSTFTNAGIFTSAHPGNDNVGTIMNTGTVSTPDGSGNGLSIGGGTTNTGPIPATESIDSSCPPLPETSELPDLPVQEVEDLPLLSSIWAKAGLGLIMMGMVMFLLYSRRV